LLGEFNTETKTKRNKGFFGIRYNKSKAKAERYIEKSGVKGYTLLRFPPILGYQDSYISPAIIPRLLKGEFYFCGKQDKLFSTFYIKNIGSLISKLVEVGSQNTALNCTDFEMTWKEFVAEYARLLKVDLVNQQKSIWSGFLHWNDKKYLLMVGYGRFGAHYPNDKLKQLIDWEPPYSWQEGVREAIIGYSKNCSENEKKIIENVLDFNHNNTLNQNK
jgi:nucleoside-diphosphate-sugar epimerase